MAVSSREQFIEYCLRNLGAPVVEINVDNEQIEDRVDEALDYWHQYHHEGIEQVYVKQRLRLTTLALATSNGLSFPLNATITGATSGAKATISRQIDDVQSTATMLTVNVISGTFVNGEVVSDTITNATLAASNAITLGEMDLKYIALTDSIYGVSKVLPFSANSNLFSNLNQFKINNIPSLAAGGNLIQYTQIMQHIELLDHLFNVTPSFRFNRLQSRIYLDIDWDTDVEPGQWVILQCYRAVDPATFTRVWSEAWLKHYATALIKRQWGTNLKKFNGILLPGGVTLDGQSLYLEAMQEIKDLEDEMIHKSSPLGFITG